MIAWRSPNPLGRSPKRPTSPFSSVMSPVGKDQISGKKGESMYHRVASQSSTISTDGPKQDDAEVHTIMRWTTPMRESPSLFMILTNSAKWSTASLIWKTINTSRVVIFERESTLFLFVLFDVYCRFHSQSFIKS